MPYTELNPSPRLLLGPGPSMVHPRVLRAMTTPMLGYHDPEFLTLLDETQAMLREVFQTQNPLTLPVSGTGMSGMEAVMNNLIEPGDKVLVCVAGIFGMRMEELARRHGAEVTRLERPWGEVFAIEAIAAELQKQRFKLVIIVHAETSTGAWQPLEGLSEVAHKHGALLVVDCVTSLGGLPVQLDTWGIDAAYAATQKCLGCPSGLAPISVSEQARAAMRQRGSKPHCWYFDLELLYQHYSPERVYHHTIPGSMIYALREGLRLVLEEGLEARWTRHRTLAEYLWAGLAELDLVPLVPEAYRLPVLTTVRVPAGVDEAQVRLRLRDEYGIEIGAGLGPLKGQVWRIGLMGASARRENVTLLLAALREILQ